MRIIAVRGGKLAAGHSGRDTYDSINLVARFCLGYVQVAMNSVARPTHQTVMTIRQAMFMGSTFLALARRVSRGDRRGRLSSTNRSPRYAAPSTSSPDSSSSSSSSCTRACSRQPKRMTGSARSISRMPKRKRRLSETVFSVCVMAGPLKA